MKKNIFCLLLAIFCAFFLSACGSAGGDEEDVSGDGLDGLFHSVELVKVGAASQLKISFAEKDGNIVHLVKGGKVAKVSIGEISFVSVEGSVIGYLPSSGKKVAIANTSVVTIDGVLADDAILISVFTRNGEKLFVNSDHVKFIGTKMVLGNGLMYYGLAADNVDFPDAPLVVIPPIIPPVSEHLHSFVVSGTTASVTFATIDGYIINVVKDGLASSVKASDVARVVWNGDIAGWDTSANAPYKKALTLPTTTLTVPVHDIGIVRFVTLDGSMFSLNTAKTQLPVGMYLDNRSLIGY